MQYIFTLITSLFLSLNVFAFPVLTDGVVDEANILSDETERTILQLFEDEGVTSVVVATVNSLEGKSVEQYAFELGNYWGIGSSKYNNGILLLIAPNEGYVRIATGEGIDKYFNSDVVIQNWMMMSLKERDFDTAAIQGVKGILVQLRGITTFPHKSHTGNGWLIFSLIVSVLLLVSIVYVAVGPEEEREKRLKRVFGVVTITFTILFAILFFLQKFLLHAGASGKGGRFSGGGRFGRGGSTGKF